MQVVTIAVSCYGSEPSGNITLVGELGSMNLKLSEEDVHRLMTLGLTIFSEQQAAMAKSLAEASVPLLSAPVIKAEFTEVDDDLIF